MTIDDKSIELLNKCYSTLDIDIYIKEHKNKELNEKLYNTIKSSFTGNAFNAIEIFHIAYYITDEILPKQKHPENAVDGLTETLLIGFDKIHNKYKNLYSCLKLKDDYVCYILSFVYVIIYNSNKSNDRYKYFLTSVKSIIESKDFFPKFESLINQEVSTSNVPFSEEDEKTGIPTQYDVFIKNVECFGFWDLEKVKCLNEPQRKKLVKLIVEKPIGYSVVMLKLIGYFDNLINKYGKKKEDAFKHVGKALQKNSRAVKGNYNILDPNSKENPVIYNSQSFLNIVQDDYLKLQSK